MCFCFSELGDGGVQTLECYLDPVLTSCGTLDNVANFSEPQFPRLLSAAQLSQGLRDILTLCQTPNECFINMAGPITYFHHFFHSLAKHVLIANSVPGTVLNTENTVKKKTDPNYGVYMLVGILKLIYVAY